jgi:hypothetical protein
MAISGRSVFLVVVNCVCFLAVSFLSTIPREKEPFALQAMEFALEVQKKAQEFGLEFDRELKSVIQFLPLAEAWAILK